jgi:phenylalanine--tRNA ligase, alpha subunit
MENELLTLKKELEEKLNECQKEADVLNIKANYVGKKSRIAEILGSLKDMSVEDKRKYGSLINNTKKEMEEMTSARIISLESKSNIAFDDSLEFNVPVGSLHPVTIVAKEITDILKKMGFTVVSGPEMETEYYNFEALNVPKDHPARDMQDTYYLDNGMVLRTQTSDNQIHAMENYGAPLRICAPGRTFRNEDLDANHENTFFQIEGMVIDEDVSIENLMYIMQELLKSIFKTDDLKVRLRPGFFPFTEPSYEMDMSCLICGGKGCPTCKNAGWIELIGCGMVHPNVLRAGGIDPDKYRGFAFGIGLTRLAMMKYKISDIRPLNSGDIRYLSNFGIK